MPYRGGWGIRPPMQEIKRTDIETEGTLPWVRWRNVFIAIFICFFLLIFVRNYFTYKDFVPWQEGLKKFANDQLRMSVAAIVPSILVATFPYIFQQVMESVKPNWEVTELFRLQFQGDVDYLKAEAEIEQEVELFKWKLAKGVLGEDGQGKEIQRNEPRPEISPEVFSRLALNVLKDVYELKLSWSFNSLVKGHNEYKKKYCTPAEWNMLIAAFRNRHIIMGEEGEGAAGHGELVYETFAEAWQQFCAAPVTHWFVNEQGKLIRA